MPKPRITSSYAAIPEHAHETLSDRAYMASRRRGAQEARERELDDRAERSVAQAVREDPHRWAGARATDIVGEHMRQRADFAENDRTIDPDVERDPRRGG